MGIVWDWENIDGAYIPKRKTFKNVQGERFGKLVTKYPIHKRDSIHWICDCACGNQTAVKTSRLGFTKSCGCLQKQRYQERKDNTDKEMKSKIGYTFNSLTITGVCRDSEHGRLHYICKCVCGNTKLVNKSSMKGTQSCGCLRKTNSMGNKNAHWKGCGDVPGVYLASVKKGAKDRNLEFSITIEDMWELFLKQEGICALSGITLSLERNKKGQPVTASLDRIDSSLGYTISNIQWIHKHINVMKNAQTMEQFIYICKKIAAYQTGKEKNNE